MTDKIQNYWTERAQDFGEVRKNELGNEMGKKWLAELETHLPKSRPLDILDVGTGTGYFAILLTGRGHRVHGVDLTEAMLEEARKTADLYQSSAVFERMDAQALSYRDHTFDVVISRNLTWTLPDPDKAYQEWFRVLKPGGILLNFDADYAANVRSHSLQNCEVEPDSPYGHVGMTNRLQQENDEITLAMDIGTPRPQWDQQVLKGCGFESCRVDLDLGKRVLGAYDLKEAPMFGVYAKKKQTA